MKHKLLFLFAFISVYDFINAQINFRDLELTDAFNISTTENKPVFFMAYESTCSHCEKMLNEIFPDTALGDFYNANFICVKKDLVSNSEATVYLKRFSISSFPTFIFLDSNGNVIAQYVGEFKPEDFIKIGKTVLIPENQLPYLKKQFDEHPADSVACFNYLQALSRGRLATQTIVNMYFQKTKNNFEFSFANWRIINTGVSDMESDIFKFVTEHRKEFSEAVTERKVNRKLYLTAAYNLQTVSFENDSVNYFHIRSLAAQLNLFIVDSLIFTDDLNVYEKNKSWMSYINTAVAGGEKFAWTDAALLRRMSEKIWQYSDDHAQLQKGANFAVRSAELKPDYFSNLSAARLYLKLGYKDFANKYAVEARQLGQNSHVNTAEADLIIRQTEN